MAEPITEAKRGRIIALARAGRGRNEIARSVGAAAATVTKVCHEAGLMFDRGPTEAATRAAKADAQALRNALLPGLLEDVELARAHLRDAADSSALHDCARAVSQLVLAHARMVQADRIANASDFGANAVDQWLEWATPKLCTEGNDDGASSGDSADEARSVPAAGDVA